MKIRNYMDSLGCLKVCITVFALFSSSFTLASVTVIENFENIRTGNTWENIQDTRIISNCELDRSDNKCLEVTLRPTSIGSPRLVRGFNIPAHDHYVLTYDVFFEPGFEFVLGGKLPGLGPARPTTGCSKTNPESWSARLMWGPNGNIRNYLYTQDRFEACGDGEMSRTPVFTPGQWHKVEIVVKLNTTPDSYDGFVITKVDGAVVSDNRDIRMRERFNNNSLISQFMFSTFFGGASRDWAPSKTVYMRFDNFKVESLPRVSATGTTQPTNSTSNQDSARAQRPAPPILQVLAVTADKLEPIWQDDFESNLGAHDNRSWLLAKPGTDWVSGFTQDTVSLRKKTMDTGNALRIVFPGDRTNSLNSGLRWRMNLAGRDSRAVFSYDFYVDNSFEFGEGGALPGIGRVNGTDAQNWMAFLTWDKDGVLMYGNHSDTGYRYEFLIANGQRARLQKGSWHTLKMQLIFNKPGVADGSVEVWMDDVSLGFLNRQNFTANLSRPVLSDMQINVFMLTPNSAETTFRNDQYLWLDNVSVLQ